MSHKVSRLLVVLLCVVLSGCALLRPRKKVECGYKNLTTAVSYVERGQTKAQAKKTAQANCQASRYGWHCGFQYCRKLPQ